MVIVLAKLANHSGRKCLLSLNLPNVKEMLAVKDADY